MNIIEACRDRNLFRPYLTDRGTKSLRSWARWMATLRALYGIKRGPDAANALVSLTERNPDKLPREGFRRALFLTGRRSGKSRIAAIIAVYEALLAGNEKKLVGGETGVVALISISKNQARVLRNYVSEILSAPMLAQELVSETKEGFELANGIEIKILAGDYRTVRGFTLVAAILDEVAFYGIADEGKIKSNEELVRALEPALLTTNGRLISITSPYSRKGYVYKTYKKHFGVEGSKTLVVNAPSSRLNPTLDQAVIDEAMLEDPASARAEYLGEFRDDIASFISRELVEACVVRDRHKLLPRSRIKYSAFVDMSGGRSDDHALAIGHRDDRKLIVDFCKRYPSGQSPYAVVREMAKELTRYGVRRVYGDNYAAEWVSRSFQENGVKFVKSPKDRSAIYLEILPQLGSGEVELLDDETLVTQLTNLQRFTRSGGRDRVDHPPGGHDDLSNAVAGLVVATKAKRVVGAMFKQSETDTAERRLSGFLN